MMLPMNKYRKLYAPKKLRKNLSHNDGSRGSLLNSNLTVLPQNSPTDGSFKSGQFDEMDVENTSKSKNTLNET